MTPDDPGTDGMGPDDHPPHGWRRGRERRRRPATRPTRPVHDPETQQALDRLTRLLAAADPGQRRVAAGALAGLPAAHQVAVVEAVLQALLGSRSEARRDGLASALADLGPGVAGLVGSALRRVTVEWQQVALAGVLGRVGLELPRGDRVALLAGLIGVLGRAAGAEAVSAVAQAVAALRHSLDPRTPGGPRPPGDPPVPPP